MAKVGGLIGQTLVFGGICLIINMCNQTSNLLVRGRWAAHTGGRNNADKILWFLAFCMFGILFFLIWKFLELGLWEL